ncbi:MAG: Multidrug export protein EmrA [Chlamydiae bacterium]|nr:Multidrug export protein EmrA [Chlamydiota bacterium]
MDDSSLKKKRLLFTFIFFGIIVLASLVIGVFWTSRWQYTKKTSDAYVQGNKVILTPLVDGFVTGVYTDDTFLVEKGQLIVQLDSADAELAYRDALQEFSRAVREVCALYHKVFAYESEIQVKEAEWIKAQEFYNHRLEVLNQGAISLENFQTSEADLEESFYELSRAESNYQEEVAKIIGKSIRTNPLVKSAEDKLSQAWINLYRCKIYAPVRGLVAQRAVQVGMWIDSGTSLLSIIPLDQIWVNMNFKETQMKHMKIGQKVKLKADMYGGDVQYKGKIVGLPGGAGNAFSILPPQNLSGNWIKIVQRLPVRVELDEDDLAAYPLRIGMTMRAQVNVKNQSGSYLPSSSKGAPSYCTNIYENEIMKSKKQIARIFLDNADPSLEAYFFTPFQLE